MHNGSHSTNYLYFKVKDRYNAMYRAADFKLDPPNNPSYIDRDNAIIPQGYSPPPYLLAADDVEVQSCQCVLVPML